MEKTFYRLGDMRVDPVTDRLHRHAQGVFDGGRIARSMSNDGHAVDAEERAAPIRLIRHFGVHPAKGGFEQGGQQFAPDTGR